MRSAYQVSPPLVLTTHGPHTGVGEDAHTTAGLEIGATGCFLVELFAHEPRLLAGRIIKTIRRKEWRNMR
jgi:hypothetical protein